MSRNWCAIFGADGWENGCRVSTHDENGSRHIVTFRLEILCWLSHPTHLEETGCWDVLSKTIQDKTDMCVLLKYKSEMEH